MKLLIDMNLSPRWCEALMARGIAATHWSTIGDAAAEDRVIFDKAREDGWTVLTNDLDFGTILATTRERRPSVIQLRTPDVRPEASVEMVVMAAEACRAEIEQGALLTVDAARSRVTLLPLAS